MRGALLLFGRGSSDALFGRGSSDVADDEEYQWAAPDSESVAARESELDGLVYATGAEAGGFKMASPTLSESPPATKGPASLATSTPSCEPCLFVRRTSLRDRRTRT